MEYLPESAFEDDVPKILCCQCGSLIESNATNMCVACLRTRIDITEGIPKQATIYFCKGCERYLQPPGTWVACALESRELIALCLKKLRGLNQVHLVDASFIWTEPHSKRLKLKLTIQKEVLSSALLQQVFIVEYMVHSQLCEDCQRRDAKDFWKAVVQVRQKTTHKKTFLYLEQLILKHRAHANVLRIRETHEGLDFFYAQKQDARKLVDFIMSVIPCRYKTSQELISHDTHNNTYNYKHTFSVEIVPVSKDNIACLPKKLAQFLGNIGQIVICSKVTNVLQVMDPTTQQMAEIPAAVYWRHPFPPLCDHRGLTEFLVLQCETVTRLPACPHTSNKHVLADVWLVPVGEMGNVDRQLHCKTHLGHILSEGDLVWGFDFTSAVTNNSHLDQMRPNEIPDVVLVKKSYGNRLKRQKRRNWQMARLEREVARDADAMDDEDEAALQEDIEEDPSIRQTVNIYKKPHFVAMVSQDDPDIAPDAPEIAVTDMLERLTVDDPMDHSLA